MIFYVMTNAKIHFRSYINEYMALKPQFCAEHFHFVNLCCHPFTRFPFVMFVHASDCLLLGNYFSKIEQKSELKNLYI